MSRLESLEVTIQQQIELLSGNQLDAMDGLYRDVVGSGYTRTAFDVQSAVGIGWDITAPDEARLGRLLSQPWSTDGRTFRDRCWVQKEELRTAVQKSMIQGLLRGDPPLKTSEAIRKQFGVSQYKAARLINTETTYFNALSARESYRDLHVDRVEIIETPDGSTCELCGGLDGTVILISQFEPGVTVPPFHPNCRGTTAPAIDPKYADGERFARGEDGKGYYVPADMTYAEWKAAFVDGGSKAVLVKIGTGFEDITDSWFADEVPSSSPVRELGVYVHNGVPYMVDGHNVVQDHDVHEKEIADMLVSSIGGKLYLVPRINNPAGVPTPDILFNGKHYDLKTIKNGTTKNTIYNRVKKAHKQADSFIVDITDYPFDDSVVYQQIRKIYRTVETQFVDEIVIVKNLRVVKVYRRK